MTKSSRFVVAAHVLALLAYGGDAMTSDYIAGSVNTNPVVVRRILALLAKAGLVVTQEGAGGGVRLGRPAESIDLRTVYAAVESDVLVGLHPQPPNPACPVGSKMDELAAYFDGDNYIQHNPQIGDGLSGLGKALKAWAKQGITMKYDKTHKVLGEGNFVLVASEGKLAGKHTAFYDLFRVAGGKITEHWDTIEAIPDRKDWKNDNGKF